jgi:hypothetical protein
MFALVMSAALMTVPALAAARPLSDDGLHGRRPDAPAVQVINSVPRACDQEGREGCDDPWSEGPPVFEDMPPDEAKGQQAPADSQGTSLRTETFFEASESPSRGLASAKVESFVRVKASGACAVRHGAAESRKLDGRCDDLDGPRGLKVTGESPRPTRDLERTRLGDCTPRIGASCPG